MNGAISCSATITDPKVSARTAGLKYVSDRHPGILRLGNGNRFRYQDSSGHTVRSKDTLNRIRSLAIPPAWTAVWISADPEGHVQAVGRDARGRKQYRYHPDWRKTRDSTKYHRLTIFGSILPKIRKRVSRDLRIRALSQAKVLATIVRLLEMTSIRVGNDEYARANRSFGLTTLKDRHVRIQGKHLNFFFRGKSGIRHRISLEDRTLAKIVRRLRDLPGYELFQFINDSGNIQSIGSMDVNKYLREISGEDFTAKDFRTWNGTVLAAAALCKLEPCASQKKLKKNLIKAAESVAEHLGNTVTICRKCYIHPAVFDAYLGQTLAPGLNKGRRFTGLSHHESAVLNLLRKWEGAKS